jgi:hypothetical protein
VAELERQLATLPASDCQPVTLALELGGDGARVTATAADGRRTERPVVHPESLVATALGLVMAIPPAPAPAQPPAVTPAPAAPVAAAPSASAALAIPGPPASTPREQEGAVAQPVSVFVGLDVGGRVAQPTSIAMADVGLHGDLLLAHWLLSAAIRGTPLGLVTAQGLDRDAFHQVSFGLGFGRRLTAGSAAFDLVLEPAILAMSMEYDFSDTVETTGSDVELSVDALVRLVLPLGKGWGLTLNLENDVIPGNLSSVPAHLQTPSNAPAGAVAPPPFPSWQGALRIGVQGSLL